MLDRATAAGAAPATQEAAPRARPGFFELDLLDNRYPALHGLRIVAILSVIQYHVTWIISTYPQVTLAQYAQEFSLSIFFGMDCFFVLSGFLIGSILLRSIDTSGTTNKMGSAAPSTPAVIKRFYLRRIFRTFPSYWLVLTFLVWSAIDLGTFTSAQRMHVIYEYTYLTNFAPLRPDKIIMFWGWSLSLEEQFYLVVPLLFVILRRLPSDRARAMFLAALMVSTTLVRIGVYLDGRPFTENGLYDRLYFRTGTRYDTIVAGILLAVVEARWGDRIGQWLKRDLHRGVLGVASLLCAWLLLRPDLFGAEHEQHVHLFTWGLVTSVMYLMIVPMVLHGEGPIVRFLSSPIFRKLATLGYGVYLVHIPVMNFIGVPIILTCVKHDLSMVFGWALVFVVVIVVSWLVAYVLHVLVEKPALRVREWLAA